VSEAAFDCDERGNVKYKESEEDCNLKNEREQRL